MRTLWWGKYAGEGNNCITRYRGGWLEYFMVSPISKFVIFSSFLQTFFLDRSQDTISRDTFTGYLYRILLQDTYTGYLVKDTFTGYLYRILIQDTLVQDTFTGYFSAR